jgi:hypothetical protein
MKLTALYEPGFEDEAIGIFMRLRTLGMTRAAIGLWMDLLHSPLIAAVDDPDEEPLQNEHRGLLIARRIVDLLWDDVQRAPSLQTSSHLAGVEQLKKRSREEKAIHSAGLDALAMIDALGEACEDYLSPGTRTGFDWDTPRFTAVMRKAFGERRAIFERHRFLLDDREKLS